MRVLDEEIGRFVPGADLLTDHDSHPTLTIDSVQTHKDGLLVTLAGVSDRGTADELRGASLLVTDRRELEEDEYWPEELLGLRVFDPAGTQIGVVIDLISGQSQDRIVISVGVDEVEVPFVAALFPSVDVASGSLVLDAPDGLLDL